MADPVADTTDLGGPGGADLGRRADYDRGTLLEDDAPADPYPLLERWLADAETAGEPEFNSMALATVGVDGQPSVRNVLLRRIEADGSLSFFTNRDSRKGVEIAGNARVGVLFSWLGLHRQVRVEGVAVPVPDDVSDRYFAGRPRQSRIGAWASEQSHVLGGRAELDARVAEVEERFAGAEVPRPPYWGGYAVVPSSIEFWQGRASRLHDRLRYRRRSGAHAPDGGSGGRAWVRERLAP